MGVTEVLPSPAQCSIYEKPYNGVQDAHEVDTVCQKVEAEVFKRSLEDVNKVTVNEVMKATAALKAGKGVPINSNSSDCMKTPSELLSTYQV